MKMDVICILASALRAPRTGDVERMDGSFGFATTLPRRTAHKLSFRSAVCG